MQVVVYGRLLKEKDIPYIQELFDTLSAKGVSTFVYVEYYEMIKERISFKSAIGLFEGYLDFKMRKFDALISLGGDGTILKATTLIRDSNVPILGINLGRLGFLASIEKGKIKESIELMEQGRYTFDERTLLYMESNLPLFGESKFALNDCTLLKRDTSSMITIHAFINGAYLTTYWADGIIIATPTGSTGYSLSCGGPIIFPNSGNFVITPVAPHNLSVRPIVISDTSVISFEIEGRAENFLCTLDSRFETITKEHQLAVRKCDFTIKLVQLQNATFMDTIRDKLIWGQDSRN
ncbi:MAG: NAD+ kinase [Saprospiraceae bacterium]|jgi:NAD+ kinase